MAFCLLIAVNVKPALGGGLGPVVGGEDHLPAEGKAVQCLLSFRDGSLQYSFCDSVSISWLAQFEISADIRSCKFSLFNLNPRNSNN